MLEVTQIVAGSEVSSTQLSCAAMLLYGTGQRDSVQQTVCGGRSHLSQQVPGELIIIEREKENDRWRGAKLREVARGD